MLRLTALVLPVLCFAVPSTAAPQEWSAAFDQPGLTNRVFSVGTYQGDLIAGGQQFRAEGQTFEHVARYDGRTWHPLGGGVAGTVRAISTFQGQLVVAGEFSYANGPSLTQTNGVALWDGANWQSLGQGLELSYGSGPMIFDLQEWHGELYAGGLFDSAGGRPIATLARWNGAEWRRVGLSRFVRSEPKVLDLMVSSDDRLIVAGEFDSVDGVSALNIAAWDGAQWSAFGPGLGNQFASVFAVAELNGLLYAGGNFRSAVAPPLDKIAFWDGAGWRPLDTGIPDWAISTQVNSLEVFEGNLYVGGDFVQAGSINSRSVAGWNGAQWFGVGGVDGSFLFTTVIELTAWNGKLVAGGEFQYAGSSLAPGDPVVSTNIASFDGAQWGQLGEGFGFGDGQVRDICAWNGGHAFVGTFVTAADQLAPRVVFRDAKGNWNYLGYVENGNVEECFELLGDLVITGDFQSIDGLPIRSIARWDGVQWHPMGGASYGNTHVLWNGDLYAGYYDLARWNGTSFDVVANTNGRIDQLWVHDDGELYLGGTFTNVGPYVARWDGSTLSDVGGGVPFAVESMTSYEGDLVVGIAPDWQGGTTPIVQRLRQGAWEPVGGGVMNGSRCMSLTVFEGDLIAGGDLIWFSGDPRDWIARWDGSAWLPLGAGLNGSAIALHADDTNRRLWVGGWFDEAGGRPSHNVALWEVPQPPTLKGPRQVTGPPKVR